MPEGNIIGAFGTHLFAITVTYEQPTKTQSIGEMTDAQLIRAPFEHQYLQSSTLLCSQFSADVWQILGLITQKQVCTCDFDVSKCQKRLFRKTISKEGLKLVNLLLDFSLGFFTGASLQESKIPVKESKNSVWEPHHLGSRNWMLHHKVIRR
eukprot:Gb_06253 [translate_table: standard]